MSLADTNRAVEEFLKVMEEAQDMATAGAVGSVFDELLCHAKELLDVMDEELEVDRQEYADLFAAAPILCRKLERLRDELRGGVAN